MDTNVSSRQILRFVCALLVTLVITKMADFDMGIAAATLCCFYINQLWLRMAVPEKPEHTLMNEPPARFIKNGRLGVNHLRPMGK